MLRNDLIKKQLHLLPKLLIMKWISVNEKVPENTKSVQLIDEKGKQCVGFYTKGHEIDFEDDDYNGEYDPIEEKNGTLYLKPGWYEDEEQIGGSYDYVYASRSPTHWHQLIPLLK